MHLDPTKLQPYNGFEMKIITQEITFAANQTHAYTLMEEFFTQNLEDCDAQNSEILVSIIRFQPGIKQHSISTWNRL